MFLEWNGPGLVLSIILATLIIPFETIAIPLLLVVSKLPWIGWTGSRWGWLNTYRVQIIPWIADGLTIFLFVQFFKDLPKELIEASRVEGASWLQIYRKVVMPLSGPVLATAAILKFLVMYNQYLWPLIVVQHRERYRPVMVGLQLLLPARRGLGRGDGLSDPDLPCRCWRSTSTLQRAFIASIASTGVKG